MTKNTTKQDPEVQPDPEPIASDLPIDDGATVDASPQVANRFVELMDFKRSGPVYDVNLLDDLVNNRRGDLTAHRDAIVDAVTNADARSDLMGDFKAEFENSRVLNMTTLNEAVSHKQSTAMDLRGQLWKIIKSLPQS